MYVCSFNETENWQESRQGRQGEIKTEITPKLSQLENCRDKMENYVFIMGSKMENFHSSFPSSSPLNWAVEKHTGWVWGAFTNRNSIALNMFLPECH